MQRNAIPNTTREDSSGSLTSKDRKSSWSSSLPAAPRGGTCDADTNSNSLSSTHSAPSFLSTGAVPRIPSSGSKVGMKKLLAAPLNGNIFVKPKVRVGEFFETLHPLPLRAHESLQSDVLMELPTGTALRVLQIGSDDHAEVLTSGTQGWIHCLFSGKQKTLERYNRDVHSAHAQIKVGDKYEMQFQVTVRTSEALDSEAKAILNPGAVITIRELGNFNKRRAKVTARAMKHLGVEGWISIFSRDGEVLVGLCTDRSGGATPCATVEFLPKFAKVNDYLDAAVTGNLASLRAVVEGVGIDINVTDCRGMTALMHASSLVHYAIVEYLIHRKDSIIVDAIDATGKNAVHHASRRPKSRRTPQHDRMQATIIKLLIQAKVSTETRDNNGCTPLMVAVSQDDVVATQELLSAQADVHVHDFEGRTALDYARGLGRTKLAQILINAGAVGEDGETPAVAPVEDEDEEDEEEEEEEEEEGGGRGEEEDTETPSKSGLIGSTPGGTSVD